MKQVDVALAIILDRAGKNVVVARRAQGAHLGGMWEFPGGKVEPGETASECAVREAREEVALDVDVVESWPHVEFAYPDRTVRLFPCICLAQSDELNETGESKPVWRPVAGLDAADFPPANASLLARLKGFTATSMQGA